jgi:GLPGLI family protein
MKVFILLFIVLTHGLTYGQLTKGYFQYSIDVEAVDTLLKTRQAVGMLRDSKMELYFTENKSRMDFKMGQVNNMSIIVDRTRNTVLSLNSNMMGKVALLSLATDIKTAQKDTSIRVVFPKETKKILGYNCKKAILIKDGVETTYWFTNEIKVDGKDQQMINPNVPGFPMAFSKIENGVLMLFELSNIREELENEERLFSVDVPEGYQMMGQK